MAGPSLRRGIALLVGIACAVLVFSIAVPTHLHKACVDLDTPYLPLCPEPSGEPQALRQELRERIARNPGDSVAWTELLVNETPEGSDAVLPGAVLAAPNDDNVARWRAAQALRDGRIQEGVALLVQVLSHRQSAGSAQVLAQIAATPKGMELMRPHLASAAQWLPQVLAGGVALKQAPADLLALAAAAVEQGTLPQAARQDYMRRLKSSGQWLDAYGLWVAQHKEFVPLLYNGGFDQPFEPDGFDWEFAPVPRSRAGFLLEQAAVARRGLVLGVEFTGRSFAAPIVRQFVSLAPGRYRIRGDYMATRLRSEEGLVWAVQCTAAAKPVVGRSAPLRDTGGVWKPIEFEISVTPDCGPVASLQLEPAAAYEATTGLKGEAAFDNFSLVRSADPQ